MILMRQVSATSEILGMYTQIQEPDVFVECIVKQRKLFLLE